MASFFKKKSSSALTFHLNLSLFKYNKTKKKLSKNWPFAALILLLSTVSKRTEKAALNSSIYTQELQANHKQQTLPPSPLRSGHTSILCVCNLAYHTILLFQFSQCVDRCARNCSHICQRITFWQQCNLTVICCSVFVLALSIPLLSSNTTTWCSMVLIAACHSRPDEIFF